MCSFIPLNESSSPLLFSPAVKMQTNFNGCHFSHCYSCRRRRKQQQASTPPCSRGTPRSRWTSQRRPRGLRISTNLHRPVQDVWGGGLWACHRNDPDQTDGVQKSSWLFLGKLTVFLFILLSYLNDHSNIVTTLWKMAKSITRQVWFAFANAIHEFVKTLVIDVESN